MGAFTDSLILKTFAFTFVNSYSSFMYVAFLKAAHFRLLNTGGPIYNAAGELSRDFCRSPLGPGHGAGAAAAAAAAVQLKLGLM